MCLLNSNTGLTDHFPRVFHCRFTHLRFGCFMVVGRPIAAAATILSYRALLTALSRAPWTRNASERRESVVVTSVPLADAPAGPVVVCCCLAEAPSKRGCSRAR